jgi:hypothetical protein
MKKIEKLVAKKGFFFGIFTNKESVANEFREDLADNVNILFAWYEYENYSGSAEVIFEQDGVLYEVSGNHCSCYGLEGQWSPQTLELKELEHRLNKGNFGEYEGFKEELKEFLEN